jgi:GxxExxY protein
MNDLLFKDEVYKIVGAAMEVYNEKGVGFLEEVYQECLEIELETRGIPFVSQKELPLYYKGRLLKKNIAPILFAMTKLLSKSRRLSVYPQMRKRKS